MTRLDELYALRDFLDREIATELGHRRDHGLIHEVADLYGTTAEEVLSGRRTRHVTRARYALAWLLARKGIPFRDIAYDLDVDRTIVSRAVARVDRDQATRALLLGLEAS